MNDWDLLKMDYLKNLESKGVPVPFGVWSNTMLRGFRTSIFQIDELGLYNPDATSDPVKIEIKGSGMSNKNEQMITAFDDCFLAFSRSCQARESDQRNTELFKLMEDVVNE